MLTITSYDGAIREGEPPHRSSNDTVRPCPWPWWFRLVAATSVSVVYGISFFLPAYEWQGHRFPGWDAFIQALQVIPVLFQEGSIWSSRIIYIAGWLPNPLLWAGIALLLSGYGRSAALAGAFAALLALVIWNWDRAPPGGQFSGYYLWVASMMFLALACGARACCPASWSCFQATSMPPR